MNNILVRIALMVLMCISSVIAHAQTVPDSGRNNASTSTQADEKGENCFALFDASAHGHSWANAYLLALASHYNYPEQLDVPARADAGEFEKRYRKTLEPWGIDTFEFVYGNGRTFDTELVVMSPHDGDFVIVVFRGSEHPFQDPVSAFKDGILTDANCKWKDVSEHLGDGVKVHEGFWNAFSPIREPVTKAIEKQGGFSPNKRLWITGNSLGAALANLCALWLRTEGYDVQGVYTYGAPRCGNDRFQERYENDFSIMCRRWVNGNDIVPMLPPTGVFPEYHHVGTIDTIKKDGSIVLDGKERKGVGNPLKHYQELYAHGIYNNLPPGIKSNMPLPPPVPKIIRPFVREAPDTNNPHTL